MLVRDKLSVDRNEILTENPLGFNQHETREGFLLCKDVPINRTGWQDYLNDEIVAADDTDNVLYGARHTNGIIRAYRDEKDVFRPETMASFEGKDIVDDHPDGPVTPETYRQHTVGVMLNVRRGEGAQADFTLADLLIKDQAAIAAVREGKRQVSCGYEADYELIGPGKVRQYNIIGNHVALVDRGRCGSRCAIGDEDMTTKTNANPGLIKRVMDAIANKDRKALSAAMDEMEKGEEKEEKDTAPENAVMEPTGTHVHIHLPGEAQAAGGEPATQSADEDPDEEAKKKKEAEDAAAEKAAFKDWMSKMDRMYDKVMGGTENKDADKGEEEEEEAEEKENESKDAAETEEEPKEAKDKKTAKDTAVKDSAHLKAVHKAVVSDAEILAPGLKMPVFDSAAAPQITLDGICLLKRRALASAMRDEKNGGAKSVKTMLGDSKFEGLACDKVAMIFNGAVALMRDRNAQDDTTVGRAKAKTKDKNADAKPIGSAKDFNDAMRERHKQPARS